MAFTSAVHSAKRFKLGTRRRVDDKEFIYLQGVASTVVGSWVTIAASFTTALAVADAQGALAVAMAATVASTYGWYQIYGNASALCLVNFDGTNGAGTWLTATAGSVDDSDVAGDAVIGAIGLTDRDATAGTSTFYLSYPFCVDGAVD